MTLRISLTLALLLTATSASCPRKTVLSIGEDLQQSCLTCDANCAICYLSPEQTTICAFCEDGYYMDGSKKCLPCVDNCASCTGPGVAKCRAPKVGFFYSQASQKIQSCDNPACATCAEKGACTSCNEGYFQATRTDTDAGYSVTCEPCNIPDCLFCSQKNDQVKTSTFTSCSLCRSGFALVSGKCQACPANCSYCREESAECSFCDKGYTLDKKTNRCEPISVANCFILRDSGECDICDNHYYQSAALTCEPCKKKYPHCSFCSGREEALACQACDIGFRLEKDNQCLACPKNCNHCNSETCVSCYSGYYYSADEGECVRCPLESCEVCRTKDTCEVCAGGFYFNAKQKRCVPCLGNCLRCFDETEDCRACPVSFFTFQQNILTQKRQQDNIFSSLLNLFLGPGVVPLAPVKITEVRIVTKCVKECPKVYKDSPVGVNWAERKCVLKLGDSIPILMPHSLPSEDIIQTISKMKLHYDQEVDRFKKASLADKTKTGSDECFRNGMLKREVRGDVNSYYICRCQPGYVGDNCQIPATLFETTQHKLFEYLDEIQKEFVDHSRHHRKRFLKAMIQLSKFRMSRPVVTKLVELVHRFLQKDRELDNKKHLYVLYDAILLAIFDQLEDLRKAPMQTAGADIELQTERTELYALIHHVVDMLETSLEDHQYLNSFLEGQGPDSFSLDTFSFMIAEYRLSSYQRGAGFSVRNANIDTSYNVVDSNRIKFEFEGDFSPSTLRNHVQVLTLAAPLFEDKLRGLGYKATSNLVYLKFINPARPHEVVYNKDNRIRKIVLHLALNYLPVFDDILSNVVCLAAFFGKNKSSVRGTPLRFHEVNKTVECEFDAYFEFRNYYFGVVTEGPKRAEF